MRHGVCALLAFIMATSVARAEIKLHLPLGRTAYQTNEWIDISVVRGSPSSMPRGLLTLTLSGADGSKIVTTFDEPPPMPQGKEIIPVQHLHVNGWLLRPGKYTVEAAIDNDKASVVIDVYSHIRQSSFKLINWGKAKKDQQLIQGEDSFGFNTFYGHYGQDDDANFIRAGVDFIPNCVMSGGHQMDLRLECDWSDPLVVQGGTRRVVRRAMMDRTRPNVPGIHFYDEPGLTWHKHPATGEFGPHDVPAQLKSYYHAYGKAPPAYHKLDPKNPADLARWRHWATWKLSLMDAAWKDSQFGVSQVKSDYLSLTQSQYGWSAFCDGYYFNVQRSLPITSGHGGYHDFGPGFFNPSYFLEMARARDQWKPCWYLPTWYGNTTNDQYRLEQYLSFQTGIQGMISPPDLEPSTNPSARAAIVETNQLMKRLGPIFTTMKPTRPPVAMLYSLSQAIHSQAKDPKNDNYVHATPHGKNLVFTYLAGKLWQEPFAVVLDEDVLDGTLATHHKAVILTSMDYVDGAVAKALEDFATKGGLVLATADTALSLKGMKKMRVSGKLPDQELLDRLTKEVATEKDTKVKEAKHKQIAACLTTKKYLEGAMPLALFILGESNGAGIRPPYVSTMPWVVVRRHIAGDIEYVFAVNAAPSEGEDAKGNPERITPTAAAGSLTLEGKQATYDAVRSGMQTELEWHGERRQTLGNLRLGPGQMRVFAETARPIGGIKVAAPVVTRDLVLEKSPIELHIAATLLDNKGGILSGSAPIHVRVVDPLGVTRHELFDATKLGQFSARLPLAANDPPGKWQVIVKEGLANTEDTATFDYTPPPRARAIAGATRRAVYFGNDLDNIFRFARNQRDVTIVKGKSGFNDAAAKRLSKALASWGIRSKEMDLTEAAKSRKLTDEEAATWVGLQYAGSKQIKSGDANPPIFAGFAVQGPVILLGNPQDNPIIDFLFKEKFLPYAPGQHMPGPGRGYIAWQRDGVGANQESITLIAYDSVGMEEAVGTCYEAVAGQEPLTKWALPTSDEITPAKSAPGLLPELKILWRANLPSRIEELQVGPNSLLVAWTADGSRITLGGDGKVQQQVTMARELPKSPAVTADQQQKFGRPDRMISRVVAGPNNLTAVTYWGGTVRIVDAAGKIRGERRLPQDASAAVWLGELLIAGLADGRVIGLR
ncbi:MAG: hypothetical protein L0Y71_08140 [Gemmataceae bacterium]|nr:hypothetical protein [Gemmataceae bacterium]